MRVLRSFVILSLLALPICTAASPYRIEITPKAENDVYHVQLNSTITFQAQGIKTNATAGGDLQVPISKIWWNFDKSALIRTASADNSITLKATNRGVSQLSIKAMVENRSLTKDVTISIGEPGK